MATAKKVEKKEGADKRLERLEVLVLANRFGAKTVWSGFMITLISTLLFVLVSMPVMMWASACMDVTDHSKIVVQSGGWAAIIVLIAVVLAYYVAIVVGAVRVVMGIYRMAHPEKYADRVIDEK